MPVAIADALACAAKTEMAGMPRTESERLATSADAVGRASSPARRDSDEPVTTPTFTVLPRTFAWAMRALFELRGSVSADEPEETAEALTTPGKEAAGTPSLSLLGGGA